MITALVFLLILSALVLIHEAGHFFVAKKFGIKVEEFGFGFPLTKALFSIKRGETKYSFYPLLIGGFVKLYGEDEAGAGKIAVSDQRLAISKKKDIDRAYFSKPLWQRFAVCIAGVFMNVVLAVVIYYAFLGISGFKTELPLIAEHQFVGVNQSTKTDIVISSIAKNSPAEKSGLQPLSRVESLNGQKAKDIDEFIKTIKSRAGSEIVLETVSLNTNKKTQVKVTPRVNPPKGEGALGVSFFPLDTVTLAYETQGQKALSGVAHPVNLMSYNFTVMKSLFDVSIKEKTAEPLSQGVSGPVGIYSVVGEIVNIPDAKERILGILNIAGLLSISLAFFNVLPIPGLDGGRLFFILIEAVTRRKLNPKFEAYANSIGIAILIGLILLVTIKDVGGLIFK